MTMPCDNELNYSQKLALRRQLALDEIDDLLVISDS